MLIAYLGNFSVPFSTESHVAASLESLEHEVLRIQEGQFHPLAAAKEARAVSADMFLWTQTYSLAHANGTSKDRQMMLDHLDTSGIPTVGYHLDRWWGLDREHQIREEPFFRCDYLFTADGGHDEQWQSLNINHHWLPPAVFHDEAYDGNPRREFACDIVFVGSWRQYGHPEWWPVRSRMIQTLNTQFRGKFRTFPLKKAVRGHDLTDLYASCKLAIGDSCLVGNPSRYWSDRVPETLGRGALLLHPYVEGIHDVHPGLPTFTSGDWKQMVGLIKNLLNDHEARKAARKATVEHTRLNHTYRDRMKTVIEVVYGG